MGGGSGVVVPMSGGMAAAGVTEHCVIMKATSSIATIA